MIADRNITGQSRLEHPPKRSHRLHRLRRRHSPHQPRLQRRPQRHRLLHHVRPPKLLHALHRLHLRQTPARRATTTSSLFTWPLGPGYQCHRPVLPACVFRFLLFPDGAAGCGEDDELE